MGWWRWRWRWRWRWGQNCHWSHHPPPSLPAGSEMRGKAVVVLSLIIRMFSLTLTVRTTLRTTLRCHLT